MAGGATLPRSARLNLHWVLEGKHVAIVLSFAVILSFLCSEADFGFRSRWGFSSNTQQHAQLKRTCHGSEHFADAVEGNETKTKTATVSALAYDYYDQLSFKQRLRAECPYFDDVHGFFHPETPHPRYIITGGAGFIGSHLIKGLREQEGVQASQIKVVDNLWRGRLANLQFPNGSWAINTTADFCALDLRNEEDTMKYLRGADYIYHLADIVAGVAYVFSHQESVFHDNILINTHTLEAAKENGIKNYIYVGTACSFPKGLQEGPGIHALREDQTYPAEPESAYGWSKLMGEYEAELAKERGVFNVGLLRFHNVYGPYSDYGKTSSQAIPSLIRKALNYPQEPYVVWGSGNQYRDFVYVDDIVRALLLVKERGMNQGVIQLGSQTATTVRDLAMEIANMVGERQDKPIEVEFDVCEPEGDQGRIAAGTRAKRILGWESKVSLRQGLVKTIDWLEESTNKTSVLVILIGQARGSDYAWKSVFQHLIQPYKAHLATFFTDASPQTILQQHAQFNWSTPEVEDWGIYMDQAAELCKKAKTKIRTHAQRLQGVHSHSFNLSSMEEEPEEAEAEWRTLCEVKEQWLGGVQNCDHPASSGILLAFRWLVAQKMLSLNLAHQYDYFVMTRADHLYLCDHFPFTNLDPKAGYVPFGEEYGGYTDRHLVGTPEFFFKMINITQEMVCNVDHFKEVQFQGHPRVNLEITQRQVWDDLKIPVKQFNRSFFTVKLPDDPTRWSNGSEDPVISQFGNLTVKYKGELEQSLEHCKVDLRAKMTDIKNWDFNGARRRGKERKEDDKKRTKGKKKKVGKKKTGLPRNLSQRKSKK